MRIASRRWAWPGLVAALTITALAGKAHADEWQSAEFTSPAGKPARGIVLDAQGEPHARLLIGCEESTTGWRGVAVWHAVNAKPSKPSAEVMVSFIGRSPVTERWQQRADGADGALLWPQSGEALRRSLLREDATRGRATVTIEIRDGGQRPVELQFALGGLGEHATEVAAACGGWGGASASYPGRRDRRW
jgi:hypothetical protein